MRPWRLLCGLYNMSSIPLASSCTISRRQGKRTHMPSSLLHAPVIQCLTGIDATKGEFRAMVLDIIHRNSPIPIYHQLKEILLKKIRTGEWEPGALIPSERELCETYGISRMTARQAITDLVNEGVCFREQGRGTFVSPRKITAATSAPLRLHGRYTRPWATAQHKSACSRPCARQRDHRRPAACCSGKPRLLSGASAPRR